MNARCVSLAVLCCAMCASAVLAQAPPRSGQRILATINGFNVTPAYLNRLIENRFARELIEEVVRTRVIEDEARARGVRVSHEDVDARLAQEQAQYESQDDFLAHIASLGYTLKGYREHLRTQLLLSRLLETTETVTDADAKEYYDTHQAEFSSETRLHIMDLAAESEADALAAYRAILDGTPFDVTARRFGSATPSGKSGDLGWVTEATVPIKQLWDLAAGLETNAVTSPVEIDGKFHIVMLAGKRPGAVREFSAVKEEIKAKLRASRGVNEADYVTSLIAKANIKVNWEPVRYLQEEYAQLKGVRVAVDGRVLRLDPAPYVAPEGVTMVPAKPVLQAVGATYAWRSGPKIMDITRGDKTVSVNLGERIAVINGERTDLGAPVTTKGGVIYIPPRAVLAGLGLTVQWNSRTRLLDISTKKPH